MKKVLFVLVCLFALFYINVNAQAYTIDDYIDELGNVFSEYAGITGRFIVYDSDSGKLNITTEDNNHNQFTYEATYNPSTDEISYTRAERATDAENIADILYTSLFYRALFRIHGYSDDQIDTILATNLSEQQVKEKYGIEIETEKIGDNTVPKTYKFTLNGMDDAEPAVTNDSSGENQSNQNSNTNTNTSKKSSNSISNPSTGIATWVTGAVILSIGLGTYLFKYNKNELD